VQLVGKGGEHHARLRTAAGAGANRPAQHVLHLLGEEMLLGNVDLTAHPGLAHRLGQRRHGLGREALQPLLEQELLQQAHKLSTAVQADALEQQGLLPVEIRGAALGAAGLGHGGQRIRAFGDDLRRAPATVEQAADQTQLVHLLGRVKPLAVRIAQRLRKAIAALPHPQRVLGQAGVALYGGDAQGGFGQFFSFSHLSRTKMLTKVNRTTILGAHHMIV
jgi:hypothetical protein